MADTAPNGEEHTEPLVTIRLYDQEKSWGYAVEWAEGTKYYLPPADARMLCAEFEQRLTGTSECHLLAEMDEELERAIADVDLSSPAEDGGA